MNLLQEWVAHEEKYKYYSLVIYVLLLTCNILYGPLIGRTHKILIVFENLYHALSIITVVCFILSERINKERLRMKVKAVLAVVITLMNTVVVLHCIINVVKAVELLINMFDPRQSKFVRVIC